MRPNPGFEVAILQRDEFEPRKIRKWPNDYIPYNLKNPENKIILIDNIDHIIFDIDKNKSKFLLKINITPRMAAFGKTC